MPRSASSSLKPCIAQSDDKLVSVYLPTKNRISLLRRAVESVLSQTHGHLELLVVDDGSTDGTAEYLVELCAMDSRVKSFRGPGRGACAARNIAIKHASGKFITGLDDDDYFQPRRLEVFIDAWERLQERGEKFSALFGDYIQISPGRLWRHKPALQVVDDQLMVGPAFVGNQVFTLTSNLAAIGGFDESFPAWQDFDAWYRLSRHSGPVHYVSGADYFIDVSHAAPRITTAGSQKIEAACALFLAKHKATLSERSQHLVRLRYFGYGDVPLRWADVMKAERVVDCCDLSKLYIRKCVRRLLKKVILR